MAEILHFEILRKHGQTNTQTNKHTHKQTNTQTDMGITIPRPPPMGGEVNMHLLLIIHQNLPKYIHIHSITNTMLTIFISLII